ncbi:hypothetical protein TSUD_241060 [Trifolium subterraneum]|uniref:Uncharacterized protein n=1 Tax=Trifolium subterraneum TaxID=3900 RepID=A0A2Z6NR61_TRISU|nr:hypothetical protein TSUD_241060 [Trifolium subterraneum]
MHQRGQKQPSRGKNPSSNTEPEKVVGGVVRQGVTFKQSLVKGTNVTQNPGIDVGCKKPNTSKKALVSRHINGCMEVEVVPENVTKFGKCWVGRLWDQKDADNIQFKIWMEGFQMVTAEPLGLDLVLLSCQIEDGVRKAVESNKEWWSRVFIEINPWAPLYRPRGRRVWVMIYGVPFHVWGVECLKKVVWGFGKLVKVDEQTEKFQRLEYARVQVAINTWDTIDKLVEIRVGDDLFVLKVAEEKWLGGDDTCVRGLCSKNRVESEASVGSPNRRWVADDDDLHGDWSRCSSPERLLQLVSNVVAVDPLGNSKIQIVADTMVSVPIDGKGVVVGSSIGPMMEGADISADEVVAAALVERSVAEGGQHWVVFRSEGNGFLGSDFCRGKSKGRLGFCRLGPGGVQQEGACIARVSYDEVVRKRNNKNTGTNTLKFGAPRCIRFAAAVQNQKRNPKKAGANGGVRVVKGTMQSSDPIQEMSEAMVYGERDGGQATSVLNLEEKGSLLEGISVGDQNLCSSNFCIEAKRLFNIGMNLGVSSNEERVSMIDSMNVMGSGEGLKKRMVRNLIKDEKVEVLALQETKLEGVDSRLCALLWGGSDVGWCCIPSIEFVPVLDTLLEKARQEEEFVPPLSLVNYVPNSYFVALQLLNRFVGCCFVAEFSGFGHIMRLWNNKRIAKARIQATLNARTSIVTASNTTMEDDARKLLVDSYVSLRRADTNTSSRVAYRMTVSTNPSCSFSSKTYANIYNKSRVHSDIDLSKFKDQDRDEEPGSGDGSDNKDADDGQVERSTAQQAVRTNGEVSPTYFTLQSSVRITKALVMRLRQHKETIMQTDIDEGGGINMIQEHSGKDQMQSMSYAILMGGMDIFPVVTHKSNWQLPTYYFYEDLKMQTIG